MKFYNLQALRAIVALLCLQFALSFRRIATSSLNSRRRGYLKNCILGLGWKTIFVYFSPIDKPSLVGK